MFDLIIIGAGPAGITAAIYAARRKINFLMLSLDLGGQASWSSDVENYTGMHFISGIELVKKFQEHIQDYNIKIKTEEVLNIEKKGKSIYVKTEKQTYEAKAVIIASGKKPKKLNVPGEEKLIGRGISYCATCDAPLQKGKKVAVIGGGNSALDASLFLSKYAEKVYLLDINEKLGGDDVLRDRVLENKKIRLINKASVKEILGNGNVNGLKYLREGKESRLNVEGIFIEIGLIAGCSFADIVEKNKWGEIKIFRSTKTFEENLTNVPGIFAAGDITDIPAKQIIVAAGEGAKAFLAAIDYLNKWG